MATIDCREAQTVLLNDAWVQTVEIQQQNNAVVESGLWLQHQTSTILGLLPLWPFLSALGFFGTTFVSIPTKHRLLGLSRVENFFVRAKELPAVKLVHEQPFVPLGSCVLQRTEPEVTSDSGKLLSQRNDLQVHHQLIDQV